MTSHRHHCRRPTRSATSARSKPTSARLEDLIRDAPPRTPPTCRHHRPRSGDLTQRVLPIVAPGGPSRRRAVPFQLSTPLARELGCVVGGGFSDPTRSGDVYGTYECLSRPDGRAHLHDKDIPHHVGNQTTTPGAATTTGSSAVRPSRRPSAWPAVGNGPVTAPRAASPGVSSCSWVACAGRHTRSTGGGRSRPGPSASTACNASRRGTAPPGGPPVSTPVAIASHVGDIAFETPLGPGIPWKTSMVGETQICERDGTTRPPRLRRRRRSHRRHDYPRPARTRRPHRRPLLDPQPDRVPADPLACHERPWRREVPRHAPPAPPRLATPPRRPRPPRHPRSHPRPHPKPAPPPHPPITETSVRGSQ